MPRRRPPTLDSRKHGTYRDDHQTPDWVLDIHRRLFDGALDVDLASSEEANRRIEARLFYTKERPCPPNPHIRFGDTVWCNPPGPAKNVLKFWDIWCSLVDSRGVGSFLVFSIDHLRMLRNPPEETYVGLLHKRVTYLGNEGSLPVGSALIVTDIIAPLDHGVANWMRWL